MDSLTALGQLELAAGHPDEAKRIFEETRKPST